MAIAVIGMACRFAGANDPELLLELAWEAFEDAAIVPAGIRGARVVVFVGAMAHDHTLLRHRGGRAPTWDTLTGLASGILANRVSYTFESTPLTAVAFAAPARVFWAVRSEHELRRCL